ncbi:MAG: hypothetical protein OXK78_10795 [Caldilineaceae bacterium]|nr:hypothetical protein [Caldilineaceae bacterium]
MGLRVLTRFVQKHTLSVRPEPTGSHEAVEGRTGGAGVLGDGGEGDAELEEVTDLVLLAVVFPVELKTGSLAAIESSKLRYVPPAR